MKFSKKPYMIVLQQEKKGFSAGILEFPGCYEEGDTVKEAVRNVRLAAKHWIKAAREQGQKIPQPFATDRISLSAISRELELLRARAKDAVENMPKSQ